LGKIAPNEKLCFNFVSILVLNTIRNLYQKVSKLVVLGLLLQSEFKANRQRTSEATQKSFLRIRNFLLMFNAFLVNVSE
jgi:hypothetical protein